MNLSEREALVDIILAHAEWVRIYYGWRPDQQDEGDNQPVKRAVASNAETIATRNLRDF